MTTVPDSYAGLAGITVGALAKHMQAAGADRATSMRVFGGPNASALTRSTKLLLDASMKRHWPAMREWLAAHPLPLATAPTVRLAPAPAPAVTHALTPAAPAPASTTAAAAPSPAHGVPALTNTEFLTAIFGTHPSEPPFVVALRGDPKGINSGWGGGPWKPGSSINDASANNYMTLATYRPDAAGNYARNATQATHIHAIVLDDLNTKAAPLSRLKAAPPTWLIETSRGNFQAGYALDRPITDIASADQMQDMLVNAGLSDPQSKSPATRLVRLPVGVNGKASAGGWHCRLVGWEPSRRYSLTELTTKLQLSPSKRGATSKRGPGHAAAAAPRQSASAPSSAPSPGPVQFLANVALDGRGLPQDIIDLIRRQDGIDRHYNDDGSLAVYAACIEMARAAFSDLEMLSVLTDTTNALADVALRRRRHNRQSAAQWLLKYQLGKARDAVAKGITAASLQGKADHYSTAMAFLDHVEAVDSRGRCNTLTTA